MCHSSHPQYLMGKFNYCRSLVLFGRESRLAQISRFSSVLTLRDPNWLTPVSFSKPPPTDRSIVSPFPSQGSSFLSALRSFSSTSHTSSCSYLITCPHSGHPHRFRSTIPFLHRHQCSVHHFLIRWHVEPVRVSFLTCHADITAALFFLCEIV